jgi:gliding motility-associated-like protein
LGDEQASHLYFEPGEHSYPINISDTFLVSLIAQTVEGCADTVRKIILFNNDPFYYVPNTFIPDGDGRNDLWKPIFSNIENIKRYSLQVFNRWGELIFSTDDPNMGWNGSFGDPTNMVQDGTYVWKIQFSWFDFKVYTATGHVNLLR